MFKKKILFITIILIFSVAISVNVLGHLIEKNMSDYVTEEVNKISKILIRKILNDDFLKDLELDDLFTINKNNSNEIELIEFDTLKVNNIIGKINDQILYYFNEFDRGNPQFINDYSNIFENYKTEFGRGLFIEVPLGVIFSNQFIIGVGPRIPIRLILSGQIESNIVTSIKQYGINNVLLEINVDVQAIEKIIFPFSSKSVNVNLKIPLVIELISGKIPENYLNSQSSDIIKK